MKQVPFFVGLIIAALLHFSLVFAQTSKELEKMPENLEKDFALSALPPHLRADASVYLLDPKKGYYLAQKGSNGFICFINRTEWERAHFRDDLASPISYDAEGARVIFPVFADVAALRASGKITAQQLKDTIDARFKKGVYKIPRPGMSYMLAPIMRSYDDASTVITMSNPHYMFYAPYLTAADIGCSKKTEDGGPVVLGDGKTPHGYAILFAGEKEKSKIMEDNKQLLKRLMEYKPYFQVGRKG